MGTRTGIDVAYFRERLKLVDLGLLSYTAQELARELVRMAATADAREAQKESERIFGVSQSKGE